MGSGLAGATGWDTAGVAVRIDVAKLKRQRSLLRDGMIVVLAGCGHPDAVQIIGEESDFPFRSGQFRADGSPMKAGVVPSPQGPLFILEPVPAQIWDWLAELAARLEGRGLSGTLTAATEAPQPGWMDQINDPLDLAAIAYYPHKDKKPGQSRWAHKDDTARELPGLIADWCSRDTETALVLAGILSNAEPGQLTGLIGASLDHMNVFAGASSPRLLRRATANTFGELGCLIHADAMTWQQQLAAVTELLGWRPQAMRLAIVRRVRHVPTFQNCIAEPEPPLPMPKGDLVWLFRNQEFWDRVVPDAHGTQILTDKHLDRAHNLDDWDITEIAPNRYRVQSKELHYWYQDQIPEAATLAKARHDFGRMIISPEVIDELHMNVPSSR